MEDACTRNARCLGRRTQNKKIDWHLKLALPEGVHSIGWLHVKVHPTKSKCTRQNVSPLSPGRQARLAFHPVIVRLAEEHMLPRSPHAPSDSWLVVNQEVTLNMGLVSSDDQPAQAASAQGTEETQLQWSSTCVCVCVCVSFLACLFQCSTHVMTENVIRLSLGDGAFPGKRFQRVAPPR